MWKLEPDIKKAQEFADYYFEIHTQLFNKKGERNRCSKKTNAYSFLTKDVFVKFLTSKPEELLSLHQQLFEFIIDHFDQKEWALYLKIKEIDNSKLNSLQISCKRKYSTSTGEIEAINAFFNYDSYISKDKDMSYFLSKVMDVNTCTYCNRSYTLTVYDQTASGKQEGLIRPEFDHWFPQSLYPDLALSYFNLIPSCKLCNSSLKHRKEMDLANYIHPYIDSEAGFKFKYLPLSNGRYAVGVDIESTDVTINRKIENTLKLFHIQEIYNAHAPFELQDIMDLANANSKDYIEPLISNVIKDLGVTERDAYRMIFGIETEDTLFLNRPFSKFKADILRQLKNEKVIKK